jgi:4'-phosphopantetheinyl transferase
VLAGTAVGWDFVSPFEGQKPVLRVDGHRLYANLSHTIGQAAVALTGAGEVGIDVEARRPVDDLQGLAATVLAPRERAALAAAADPLLLFFRLWARKEAVIKAFGIGLGAPLTSIDLSDAGAPRVPETLDGPMRLADLDLPTRVAAAVALLAPVLAVRVVTVPIAALARG